MAEFISIEAFRNGRTLGVVPMPKSGKQMLVSVNASTREVEAVVASIQDKLKGATAEATLNNLRAANLNVRLPEPGELSNSGKPALACVCASQFAALKCDNVLG